jgi:hypothetical protein
VDPWGLAPGDPYKTPRDAAAEALREVFCKSVREDREYGGRIVKNPDGTYTYTAPRRGTRHGYEHTMPAPTNNAGRYHTHGAKSPHYEDETFSDTDETGAMVEGVPSYLATPSGQMKEFDPTRYADPAATAVIDLPTRMPRCEPTGGCR